MSVQLRCIDMYLLVNSYPMIPTRQPGYFLGTPKAPTIIQQLKTLLLMIIPILIGQYLYHVVSDILNSTPECAWGHGLL